MVGPKSETMTKKQIVFDAAHDVINAIKGTPLNQNEFNPSQKFNTLLINARTRRPWAVLNKKPLLVSAIDNLIKTIENIDNEKTTN